jgi:hypothetical protein
MKVAVVTNWDEHCGNAEYAANLVHHAKRHSNVQIKIVPRPLTFDHIYAETRDVDLIHFNCVTPEFRSLTTEQWPWPRFKEGDKNLTMMLQDSSQLRIKKAAGFVHQNEQSKWVPVFDCIAVHEDPVDEPYPPNVRVIPHGLLIEDVSDVKIQLKVGVAGFPMPWKGFIATAQAARNMKVGFLAIIPESKHVDVEQTKRLILEVHPEAEIVTEWLSQKQVIRRLAECFVTVFAYDEVYTGMEGHEFAGISGGVRFGLSARRPIIISHCSLLRDLHKYPHEIYAINKTAAMMGYGRGIEMAIRQVFDDYQVGCVRRPARILQDMNWDHTACMYLDMWNWVGNHYIVGVEKVS